MYNTLNDRAAATKKETDASRANCIGDIFV
jgi:hypothetical protein